MKTEYRQTFCQLEYGKLFRVLTILKVEFVLNERDDNKTIPTRRKIWWRRRKLHEETVSENNNGKEWTMYCNLVYIRHAFECYFIIIKYNLRTFRYDANDSFPSHSIRPPWHRTQDPGIWEGTGKNSPIMDSEIFCDEKWASHFLFVFELKAEQDGAWEWMNTAPRGISKPAYYSASVCVCECLLKYKKWILLKCQFIFHMRYCKLKLRMQTAKLFHFIYYSRINVSNEMDRGGSELHGRKMAQRK